MFELLNIPELWQAIMSNIYYLMMLSIVVILVLENRNPIKSLSWILVLVAFPVLGLLLYVFLGQNIRRNKIISKKSIKQVELINGYYEALKKRFSIKDITLPQSLSSHRKLIGLLYKNNHALYTQDNEIAVYVSGQEVLEEMLATVEKAQHFIHFQSYIFEANDKLGKRFVELLKQKAKSGVEVRLLVDSVGSWNFNKGFHQEMNSCGVETAEFLKVTFPSFTHKVNYRNHRKILVVDGEIGFVGGVNVADRYYYGDQSLGGNWRDTHLKIQGSAVNGLQSIFIQDWYFASRKKLTKERYFNLQKREGDKRVQIASSAPDSDWKAIEQAVVLSISSAVDYIYLQSPYFLPTASVRMAMTVAAMSGVDVRLMIPYKSDGKFTQLASHSYIKEMLEAGVRIFRYQAGFIHSKMLVSDDNMSSVGSSNMDFRSFESNFEVNAFVYDQELAQKCKNHFLDDEKCSIELLLKDWDKRSGVKKIAESFARLFSSLL